MRIFIVRDSSVDVCEIKWCMVSVLRMRCRCVKSVFTEIIVNNFRVNTEDWACVCMFVEYLVATDLYRTFSRCHTTCPTSTGAMSIEKRVDPVISGARRTTEFPMDSAEDCRVYLYQPVQW